jgi:glycosyltransferase involved in cell wall biosynthesis
MELSEYIINNRHKYNFINNPQNESDIKIVKRLRFNQSSVLFSIVMPVHNQETIIEKNLNAILNCTGGRNYEIILILDACSDNTENTLLEWLDKTQTECYPLFSKLTILKSESPLFETAADNLGFFCAQGNYLLEIQADMTMTEKDYNMKLLKPFLQDSKIVGISGRCCHSFDGGSGVGKMGRRIELDLKDLPEVDPYYYYIGDTCNRGPLLIDRQKLVDLGYLDETNFFLDNSDHDFFARAKTHGWKCGYCPIEFKSKLEDGSTRKTRDLANEIVYQKYKQEKTGAKSYLLKATLKSSPITKHILIN